MEQSVWVFIGVLSVIIAIGIVMKTSHVFTQEQKLGDMIWAIDKLETNFNFICKSPIGTRLTTEVNLPSGSVMKAEGDRLCITWESEVRCRLIDCEILLDPITDPIILDLDTDIARRSFDVWKFGCSGVKTQDGIEVECQG